MITYKRPAVNLKLKYRKALELGTILSILIMILVFHAVPDLRVSSKEIKPRDFEIKVEDIPKTEYIKKKPAPPRVSVPIPTESEDIPEDLTIESTELDLSEIPPPPPPPNEESEYESYVFIPYDEAPVPIGGYAAIQKNLEYPNIARQAGVEARVIIAVLIDEKGGVVKTQILQDAGLTMGFEEKAEKAVKSVRWKPAKQRDNPVKVWVSIPIRFSLSSKTPT